VTHVCACTTSCNFRFGANVRLLEQDLHVFA
jgi:hypothetical protein